jgi:hypothetical protein
VDADDLRVLTSAENLSALKQAAELSRQLRLPETEGAEAWGQALVWARGVNAP